MRSISKGFFPRVLGVLRGGEFNLRGGALIVAAFCAALSMVLRAAPSGLDPAEILKPLGDSWPTYSGDYTGRRYSSLTQINQSNVTRLTLVYAAKVSGG